MADSRTFVVFPEKVLGRIPHAKIVILNALMSLVDEYDFDKITVRQICERADVSKTTFYQHFGSKSDIMHWHYNLVSDAGTAEIGRTLTWEDGHLITSAGIASALKLYDAAARSSGYDSLVPYSARKRSADIHDTLSDYRHIKITPKLEFQITALVAGEQAAVHQNFHELFDRDVYELTEYLVSIVPKDLYEALQPADADHERQWDNPWDALYQG